MKNFFTFFVLFVLAFVSFGENSRIPEYVDKLNQLTKKISEFDGNIEKIKKNQVWFAEEYANISRSIRELCRNNEECNALEKEIMLLSQDNKNVGQRVTLDFLLSDYANGNINRFLEFADNTIKNPNLKNDTLKEKLVSKLHLCATISGNAEKQKIIDLLKFVAFGKNFKLKEWAIFFLTGINTGEETSEREIPPLDLESGLKACEEITKDENISFDIKADYYEILVRHDKFSKTEFDKMLRNYAENEENPISIRIECAEKLKDQKLVDEIKQNEIKRSEELRKKGIIIKHYDK